MEPSRQDPIAAAAVTRIERALLAMRRDQQARRLQRGAAGRGHEHGTHRPDHSLGGAARFRLLDALEPRPRTVTDLADATGVDQPRASRLVADAVDRGLVRRGVDPADARRAIVELTASGRAFLTAAHGTRRQAVETALGGFSVDEAARFAELLDRFVAAWPREATSPARPGRGRGRSGSRSQPPGGST
jgi:DNA-binding MarR family transcriptional regulator